MYSFRTWFYVSRAAHSTDVPQMPELTKSLELFPAACAAAKSPSGGGIMMVDSITDCVCRRRGLKARSRSYMTAGRIQPAMDRIDRRRSNRSRLVTIRVWIYREVCCFARSPWCGLKSGRRRRSHFNPPRSCHVLRAYPSAMLRPFWRCKVR